ncbi:MAG: hypothetical protein A2W99_00735 [Bacteroidetes bacterium GWF2_33_16]|nr:MAG: hypothetical protein A2X00_03440 [Bacteroidetes bacterium GWE2_32_14]OFY08791.1 MAG: hypothetical protein A2W99_00735 [Bacteroidetes bacterium GWF2_33_16]
MAILKLLLITIMLVFFAMLGLSVRLIFKSKGEFRGSSCNSYSQDLKDRDIGCGCGSTGCIAE